MKRIYMESILAIFMLINCQFAECSYDINEKNIGNSFERPTEIIQRQNNIYQDSISLAERRRDAERRAREAIQATRQIFAEHNGFIDYDALEFRLLGCFLAEAEGQYQDEVFEITNEEEQALPNTYIGHDEQDLAEIYSREDRSNELSRNHDRTEELSFSNNTGSYSEEILLVNKNGNEQDNSQLQAREQNFFEADYSR